MEILRFEEAAPVAPKRKKSSKGYLTLGFVAALFSVGSAFATTTSSININNREPIALGQGITTFTTCDSKIAIIPVTKLNNTATDFVLDKVTIGADYGSGADKADYLINNSAVSASAEGCLGVDFVIKFYKGTSGTPVNACTNFTLVTNAVAGTSYKCFPTDGSSRVVFKVSQTSHDIKFDGTAGTSFFDRISIETASGTDYTS